MAQVAEAKITVELQEDSFTESDGREDFQSDVDQAIESHMENLATEIAFICEQYGLEVDQFQVRIT